MTKYFAQDTPQASLERMMMSVPGFQRRGGGIAEYNHDLRDVPPYLLEMLAEAGICLGEFEKYLVTEKILYGE